MKNNVLSNSSKVWDKALDVLLEETADMALEQLDKELPEPKEDIVFSAEHERKMKRLFRRERSKLVRKKAVKYTRIAAVVLVALILCAGVSIASVEAWRVQFLNYVLDLSQPNTDFDFSETNETVYGNDKVKIGYVPQGFELIESRDSRPLLYLNFDSGEQYFQIIVEYSTDMNNSIDTEDGTVENTTVNGYEAVYTSNPNGNSILWHDGDYVYTVAGNIDKKELLKIAENIQKQ